MEIEELTGRITMLAIDLAEEFPAEIFTRSSMLEAARNRFWPNFGDLCEMLSPLVQQHRESMRFLALPPPRPESREPYDPGPAPDWCCNRNPRHLVHEPARARDPVRTADEQIAAMRALATDDQWERARQAAAERAKPTDPHEADDVVVPLRAAAAELKPEIRRGPPLDDDQDA
jgi:hypothetical protein